MRTRHRLYEGIVAASRSYVVIVALALVVGLLVAPFAWELAATPPGTVAVIPIAGFIDGPNTADVSQRLQAARSDSQVEAVVLVVDSGGGQATASEELYMQVARTAEEKPVVAVVDAAATSGAYMAILPADHIYVKPASTVGSIGTTVARPPTIDPLDEQIASGPNKLVGTSPREYEYYVETVTESFISYVMEHRRDNLTLDRDEIARASIYVGVQSVEFGLADDIGDRQAAIEHAADDAGMDRYTIRTSQYSDSVRFLSRSTYTSADVPEKTMMNRGDFTMLHEDPVLPSVLLVPPGTATAMADAHNESDSDMEGANESTR